MSKNKNYPSNQNAIYLTCENMSVMNSKSHITISRDHWEKSLLIHATVYFVTFDDNNDPVYNDGGCYYIMDLEKMTVSSVQMVPEIKRSYGKNRRLSIDFD